MDAVTLLKTFGSLENIEVLHQLPTKSPVSSYFSPSSAKAGGGGGLGSSSSMLKTLQTRLRAFVVFASKVWTFICYVFRKQTRSVRFFPCFSVFVQTYLTLLQHTYYRLFIQTNSFTFIVLIDFSKNISSVLRQSLF